MIFDEGCFPCKGDKLNDQVSTNPTTPSPTVQFDISELGYQAEVPEDELPDQGEQHHEDQGLEEDTAQGAEFQAVPQNQLASYHLARDKDKRTLMGNQDATLMLNYFSMLQLLLLKCRGLNLNYI